MEKLDMKKNDSQEKLNKNESTEKLNQIKSKNMN